MRRMGLMVGGMVMTATLASGAAMVSAAQPGIGPKQGPEWTFTAPGVACDRVFLDGGNYFEGSRSAGSGTYDRSADTMTLRWTSGSLSGDKFEGVAVSSTEYSGALRTSSHTQIAATLERAGGTC